MRQQLENKEVNNALISIVLPTVHVFRITVLINYKTVGAYYLKNIL